MVHFGAYVNVYNIH